MSHYWFGKTGIDDVYAEGKRISALIFWNKNELRPLRGLCSSDLGLCAAYSGVYLDPAERQMRMSPSQSPQEAFAAFVACGFRDSSHLIKVEDVRLLDFEAAQMSVALPRLEPPSSIVRKEVPAGARDANRSS